MLSYLPSHGHTDVMQQVSATTTKIERPWCVQILAAEFGSNDWNSDEEDGFDPYWGVVDEAQFSEAYIRQQATFLLRQLTPMMGRHAPKCGFLKELSDIAETPMEGLMQPGGPPCHLPLPC